jgi:hypothetical protein
MTQAATLNRELCARAKVHWTAQQITLYVVSTRTSNNNVELVLTWNSIGHLTFKSRDP